MSATLACVLFDSNWYKEGRPYVDCRIAERDHSAAAWTLSLWAPSRIMIWSDPAGARHATLAVVVSMPTAAGHGN